jgi:hypothetical protein
VRLPIILIAFILTTINAKGDVTKTVGTTGADYPTLKAAFDAINAGTIKTGIITLNIIDNTTETATASLSASGTGSSSYTQVIINPSGGGARTISGSLNAPVITLNGADYATINGLNTDGNSLTIENSNTGTLANAILLTNTATYNIISNCTILGSTTSVTTNYPDGGVIAIITASGNNQISYCNIGPSGTNKPSRLIYNQAHPVNPCNSNTIDHCNLYDFSASAAAATTHLHAGIMVLKGSAWTITNNSFYYTSEISPTYGTISAVYLAGDSGYTPTGSFIISGNYIGGSSPNCGGSSMKITGSAYSFKGIWFGSYFAQAAANKSTISNNYLRNITYTSSNTETISNSGFSTIFISSGRYDITGNQTGRTDINGDISINMTGAGSGNTYIQMLYCDSNTSTTWLQTYLEKIENNSFAGINVTRSNGTQLTVKMIYIYFPMLITSFSNNSFGSESIQNSININGGDGECMMGQLNIKDAMTASCSGNSVNNVTISRNTGSIGLSWGLALAGSLMSGDIAGNSARNISVSNTSGIVYGITAGVASGGSISGNKVENITASSVTALYSFAGGVTIEKNFVRNIISNSISGTIYGLQLNSATTSTIKNNVIVFGQGDGNNCTRYGIYLNNAGTVLHNTVYIGGTGTIGSGFSYAFYSNNNANPRIIRNNIFSNFRSNSGGTGSNYGEKYAYTVPVTLTLSNNSYYSPGNGGIPGIYALSGYDAGSIVIDPLFANTEGTNATDFTASAVYNVGATGTGVTTDYLGNARSETAPSMGAFEYSVHEGIVTAEASSGTASANYNNLASAFAAINAGTHQGAVVLKINAPTWEPGAVINASGTGSANYTSVSVYPTVSGLSTTTDFALPVINLNGADNITIDGRINASGSTPSLTVRNLNTSNTVGTSAVRFINDATSNTVRYCNLKGAHTTSYSGIVFFSNTTGTSAGSGNNSNTIDNNNITGLTDLLRPYTAVFSSGQAGYPNLNNIISNNRIFDIFNRTVVSPYGIYLYNNSTAFSITGNSIFETATFVPTTASTIYPIIINYASGNAGDNFTVSGNFIGGTAEGCSGSAFTKSGAQNTSFYGIKINAGTTNPSSIQGNVIRNISWTNSGNSAWYGIQTDAGNFNIGTETGNTIGSGTGTGSIVYNASTTGALFYGINIAGIGPVNCSNNLIGSISAGNAAANGTSVYAINKAGVAGNTTISTNIIGSADGNTANSINATSQSTGNLQDLYAIFSSGTGTNIISGNLISNLTNGSENTTAATTGSIAGIYAGSGTFTISGNTITKLKTSNANNASTISLSVAGIIVNSTTGAQTISGNSISYLSNTYNSFSGNISGLFYLGGTTASTVATNFIHSLSSAGNSAIITGIMAGRGATSYNNNIVTLEQDNASTIYGIYETGASSNNNNLYFNTIYIGGSPASGSLNSYALYSAVTTNTRNFRNNIFNNSRSNKGATGKHYAAYFNYSANTNLTLDYNDYYTPGTGGVPGFYAAADKTVLPIVTSKDASSVLLNPSFASPGGTTANSYIPATQLAGITGTGITSDYASTTRSATVPEMGAFEKSVTVNWAGTVSTDWSVAANWSTSAVPTASYNITIPAGTTNAPHITSAKASPSICNNLTISSGAIVTIDAGKALTVNGTITNNAGASGLVIKSDDTGDGSFIGPSTQATVERYIPASKWVFLSSPVTSAVNSLYTGMYMKQYNETANVFGPLVTATNVPLTPGTGNSIWSTAAQTISYEGTINAGNVSVSTPRASQGFTLCGNPYTSAIDWNSASGWSKTNLAGTIWVWNQTTGQYATWNGSVGTNSGSRYLSSGQGFFVQAAATGASVGLMAGARLHNTVSLLKSVKVEPGVLRMIVTGNSYSDEAVVMIAEDALPAIDYRYDALKMAGSAEAPQLSTVKDGQSFTIASHSLADSTTVIPVTLKVAAAGTYSMNLSNSINTGGLNTFLIDKIAGTATSADLNPVYTFTASPSDRSDRFEVIFSSRSVITAISKTGEYRGDIKIWNSGRKLNIEIPENEELINVEIYNLNGIKVKSFTSGSLRDIDLNLNTGMYVVRVKTTKQVQISKIVLY